MAAFDESSPSNSTNSHAICTVESQLLHISKYPSRTIRWAVLGERFAGAPDCVARMRATSPKAPPSPRLVTAACAAGVGICLAGPLRPRQIFFNLLSNAVKNSRQDESIAVAPDRTNTGLTFIALP
jgi:signal transduction histidine kinase